MPCFLGAEYGSNNSAELTAIGEALLYARDFCKDAKTICIKYDSEYAAFTIQGIYNGQKNKKLYNTVRDIYEEVKATHKVLWYHVKGHSGNIYNDMADSMATKGAKGFFSE